MPNDLSTRSNDSESTANESETSRPPTAADRLDALDSRLTSLEAELDSIRGLLGGVEAVDEAVERRASIALAKAELLERAVGVDDGLIRERLPEADEATATAARAETDTDPVERRQTGRAVDPLSVDDGVGDESGSRASDNSLASRLRDAFR